MMAIFMCITSHIIPKIVHDQIINCFSVQFIPYINVVNPPNILSLCCQLNQFYQLSHFDSFIFALFSIHIFPPYKNYGAIFFVFLPQNHNCNIDRTFWGVHIFWEFVSLSSLFIVQIKIALFFLLKNNMDLISSDNVQRIIIVIFTSCILLCASNHSNTVQLLK